jgi:hypothetical protein
MTNTIDAKAAISSELAPDIDGAALAKAILAKFGTSFDHLVIDMTAVGAQDLVSSFVNAFLTHLAGQGANMGKLRIEWRAKYESETAKLGMFTSLFLEDFAGPPSPSTGSPPKSTRSAKGNTKKRAAAHGG